jgi:RNA polymerase sigma-70 factor (ECF subfamily)
MAVNNETELVNAARDGDKKAFEKLVEKHSKKIYHTALHLIADTDEAKDLTQETFVKAYRAIDRFDGRSSFMTWIYRILVNLSLNRRKELSRTRPGRLRDQRIQAFVIDKSKKDEDDPEKQVANRRTIEALVDALEDLSEVLRTTLVLVVFENVDYKQAAQILGCSEGTVAWRVFRAREILREKLKGHLT